jgi:hypothetical protein
VMINKRPDERGAEMPIRKADDLKKFPHESEKQYLNRLERVCANSKRRIKHSFSNVF